MIEASVITLMILFGGIAVRAIVQERKTKQSQEPWSEMEMCESSRSGFDTTEIYIRPRKI